jgi:hypothetical protein
MPVRGLFDPPTWSLQFLDALWNRTSFVRPMGLAVSGDNDAIKDNLTNHPGMFESHALTVPRCYLVATLRNEGEDREAALVRNRLRVPTAIYRYTTREMISFHTRRG